MKYAIMVMFEGDWMYVTLGSGENIRVRTFDNFIDAEDVAEAWRLSGREQYVKVVPYNESKDS